MKKISLFVLFLFSIYSFSLLAQSKEDTKAWIKAKMETFSNVIKVDFQNDKINIYFRYGSGIEEYRIPISSIQSISIMERADKERDYYIDFNVSVSENKKIEKIIYEIPTEFPAVVVDVLDDGTNYTGVSYTDITTFSRKFFSYLKESDIANRLSKAISHLATLYGAKLIDETF